MELDTYKVTAASFTSTNLLSIQKDNRIIFNIDNDGVIKAIINGELKEIENENELAIAFFITISELYGFEYLSKDELISKIITNYRESRVNKVLI